LVPILQTEKKILKNNKKDNIFTTNTCLTGICIDICARSLVSFDWFDHVLNTMRPDALPNLSEEDLLLLRVGGHVVQEEAGCGRGRVYVSSRTKRLGPALPIGC
jgi:hypothetical protein